MQLTENVKVKTAALECRPTLWRGRAGCLLANDVVELTHLTGGGQIPEFRFRDAPETNPFWIPRWKLRDPMLFRPAVDAARYGWPPAGKLLSAIAGHSLCLGTFGMPSEHEVRAGAVLHGEAGVRPWRPEFAEREGWAEIRLSVRLPRSALEFTRTLSLRRGETVVRVRESVRNLLGADQFIQWQQHVAFGPPFLASGRSSIALPGTGAVTDPNGYEGCELLAQRAEFAWPGAPGAQGGVIDLRQPFSTPETGFVAGVQLDPGRKLGFVCALNHAQAVACGYLFLRDDFPWVTVWEENLARQKPPWNGREQVRALEFGVSPLPAGRSEMIRRGDLFGSPVLARLPAKGELHAAYAILLARCPEGTTRLSDIACGENEIELRSERGESLAGVPAQGVREFLMDRQEDL